MAYDQMKEECDKVNMAFVTLSFVDVQYRDAHQG